MPPHPPDHPPSLRPLHVDQDPDPVGYQCTTCSYLFLPASTVVASSLVERIRERAKEVVAITDSSGFFVGTRPRWRALRLGRVQARLLANALRPGSPDAGLSARLFGLDLEEADEPLLEKWIEA